MRDSAIPKGRCTQIVHTWVLKPKPGQGASYPQCKGRKQRPSHKTIDPLWGAPTQVKVRVSPDPNVVTLVLRCERIVQ